MRRPDKAPTPMERMAAAAFTAGLPSVRPYKKPAAVRACWCWRPRQARELLKREQAAP